MQYYKACHHLTVKCTKFDFRSGCTPDPAGGAYNAPQTHYLYLRGLFLRGGRGKGIRWAGMDGRTEGGAREQCEA